MKMYIVSYSSGSDEDWREHLVFATHDEEKAQKYREKANNILTKWKPFYLEKSIEEQEKDYEEWIFSERGCRLEDINYYYIMEIEVR